MAHDLRKPQDYFHRIWATAFRPADLADVGHTDGALDGQDNAADDDPAEACA